jgi:hypothetical protein
MKLGHSCLSKALSLWFAGMMLVAMSACGGSSGSSDPPPMQPSPPPPPMSDVRSFSIELTGGQEVPPTETGASALAELDIDLANGAVSGSLQAADMQPTAAHIHIGHAGANGPVVVPLQQDGGDPLRFEVPANASLSAAQLDTLMSGGLYLNVHSAAHPDGEVRGQILPEDFSLVFAELSGSQQLPPQDILARGWAAITLDESASATAGVQLTLFGLGNASSVALHEGYAGTQGPMLGELVQSTTNPGHWFVEGLALDEDALASLRAGRLYLDVAAASAPDGLLRGQFVPEGVALLIDALSGAEEVPPVDTEAAGISALTLELDSLAFQIHVNTQAFEDASAAHIHHGFAGVNGPVLVPLAQDSQDLAHWSATGELGEAELELLGAGALYVNVHSPGHPGGEIRAQLRPDNIEVLFAPLDGEQLVPPVETPASGLAAVTVDKAARTLVAHVRVNELLMSTSGGIHRAPAGENGPERIPLEQDTEDVDHWFAAGAALDEEDYAAFLDDGLYMLVASQPHPDGEIRGQLVRAAALPVPDAPAVSLTAPEDGSELSGTVAVVAEVESSEEIVEVRFYADGEPIGSVSVPPFAIDWDTTAVADGPASLTAQAEDSLGSVGVSAPVVVTVANDSASGMTLVEIQAQVFTPRCAVCHFGSGNELPFSMNLNSAEASFDSLVNVPSEQVPGLLRVKPDNPDDSYLIHKLEGTQAVGDRMPQGGPFLDAATIQGIRGWIADGAPSGSGDPPPPPPPGY